MNLPVLIVRPEDGAQETRKRAEALGLQAIVDPLFKIQSVDWETPRASEFDAIMLTSANAIKYAGDGLQLYASHPAYVVGEPTASAARNAGMQVAHVGDGGAQKLVDDMAQHNVRKALRLVGRNFTSVETDVFLENRIVYEAISLPLGERARATLNNGCIMLLHSSRAATEFDVETGKFDLDRTNIHVVAISKTAGRAAGLGWKSINVAEKPTDDALLSAASALCRA